MAAYNSYKYFPSALLRSDSNLLIASLAKTNTQYELWKIPSTTDNIPHKGIYLNCCELKLVHRPIANSLILVLISSTNRSTEPTRITKLIAYSHSSRKCTRNLRYIPAVTITDTLISLVLDGFVEVEEGGGAAALLYNTCPTNHRWLCWNLELMYGG